MSLVVRLVQHAKGRPVTIDEKVSVWYALGLSFEKFSAVVRGLLKARKFVFIGRGTTVRAPNLLFAEIGVEIANYCQIDCLSHHGLLLGRGTMIGIYSIVKVSGTLSDLGLKVEIGRNVGIGDFALIGDAGGVQLGDDTITGAYLSIHPENHNYGDRSQLIRLRGVSRQAISIDRDCWIGAKATFLDCCAISIGCVVAAGAMLTQVFPDHVIIDGGPARIIKHVDGTAA